MHSDSDYIISPQYAIKTRIKNRGSEVKKDHWLDWADDKYDVS